MELSHLKSLGILSLWCISLVAFSDNQIWLQDIECKILSSDFKAIEVFKGDSITHVCNKIDKSITCSLTANATFDGGKPSTVATYTEVFKDDTGGVWQASSYNGIIIFDIKNKRYSGTQTMIGNTLMNKQCVGVIKSYE